MFKDFFSSDLVEIFFRDHKVSFEMLHFCGAGIRPFFDEVAQKKHFDAFVCECSVLMQNYAF